MSIAKDNTIEKILSEFEKTSGLALKQMEKLKKVIASKENGIPSDLIEKLKKNEEKLNNLELKISEKIISAIVLYNPVASELRHLMACYRMLISLERIGDLVLKTTNSIQKLNDSKLLLLNLKDINQMIDIATEMISKASLSFVNDDKQSALWVIQNDAEVDKLNKQITKNSITGDFVQVEKQKALSDYSAVRSIVSSIERIADHATHIAEAAIFASEGIDIRHNPELLS